MIWTSESNAANLCTHTYMVNFAFKIDKEGRTVARICQDLCFSHLASPPVLLNPMSCPPLRSVLVSDDELSESDDKSDRFSTSAL